MSDPTFAELGLDPRILQAVGALGFDTPTPIQAAALPPLLAGKSVIGRARTGSGKTAAFGLPLLQRVADGGGIRALVLSPTRELAIQVTDALRSFAKKLPVRVATIYGGSAYPPQFDALRRATVVVGTPGRLLDHLERGSLDLSGVEVVVLDEADEMLRMGFFDDVTTLFDATPDDRQAALFSATMPPQIQALVERRITDVVTVQVEGEAMTTAHIDQVWMRVPQRNKLEGLVRLLRAVERDATLVFARTRMGCAELADALIAEGFSADALHGDLSQSARERVLGRLRTRQLDIVVATDVAARGIDVDHITHVVNIDLPWDTEIYVHRIGRTGRVGREGTAISFATPKQKQRIREMSRQLGVEIRHVPVPSDADIVGRQRAKLQRRLDEAREGAGAARGWLAALADAGWSVEDVAAAALALLAEPGTFDEAHDDAPPAWAQSRPERAGPRDPEAWRDVNEVALFFPIGRRDGLRPADVVGALANEAGIPGRDIGRVSIFDRKTFVGVAKATAQAVLDRIDRLEIRGNTVPVKMAWPEAVPEPRHQRRRRAPGRHGRRRH